VFAWVEAAKIHAMQGDLRPSERCLREAIRLAPENPSLRLLLADVLMQLQRTREANQQLESLKRMDPKFVAGLKPGSQ